MKEFFVKLGAILALKTINKIRDNNTDTSEIENEIAQVTDPDEIKQILINKAIDDLAEHADNTIKPIISELATAKNKEEIKVAVKKPGFITSIANLLFGWISK